MMYRDFEKSSADQGDHTVSPAMRAAAQAKFEILNRPSQKVIEVGAALHRASQALGLFKVKQG